jgi:hypothetical protein
VCDPAARFEYEVEDGFFVPQSTKLAFALLSNAHWNFEIDPESVYVNDAEVLFVGFAGPELIDGVGGPDAANALRAAHAAPPRTQSNATVVIRLALPPALMTPPTPI